MKMSKNFKYGKLLGLSIGLILFFVILIFVKTVDKNPMITRMIAVAVLMATLWISEAVPLSVTALLPVVLYPMLGIMNGKDVSETYFNHIIFLFIGGFIVALAMEKWNLHKRIALRILLWMKIGAGNILLGFMFASFFLSMWISNTATTMMMIPIVLSIINRFGDEMDEKSHKKYSIALLLGIAYSASVGGIATLIGTPPNIVFTQIFSISFPDAPEVSFAQWMIFALPLSLAMFFITWSVLYILYVPKKLLNNNLKDKLRKQYNELGKISFEETVVLIAFIILAFLWFFRSGIDVDFGKKFYIKIPGWSKFFAHPEYFNDGTVAVLISLLLFIIPSKNKKNETIMDKTTALKLPWNIVLLFGGGFALAKGFVESGLSEYIAESFSSLTQVNPILLVFAIAFFLSILTEFTSNTATSQMALPLLAAVSVSASINPLLVMIPATVATSLAFIMPVSTPPNVIIFGTGKLKIKDMAKPGIIMDILGVVILTVVTFLIVVVLFKIEPHVLPQWAENAKFK